MFLPSEKRTEVSCAARALFAGAILAAAVKAEPAHADENSTLFKAVNDLCVNHSGTVDAIAAKALKMPFQASNYGSEKEGYYARQIALEKLGSGGTVVIFYAKSKRAPMNECHFASYSDDVADIVQTAARRVRSVRSQAAIRFSSCSRAAAKRRSPASQ